MQRSRVEALLASFPKLADTASQHTTVEQDNVRFVYQPLDELYMVLITNRQSNILQDISTLHLFAQVVGSICKSLDEREITRCAFELLSAFDEVVTLGYRENLTLAQIKTFLDMESHEERIQEIIARNKELEASEERKRKAKQLEMQRKEMSRAQRAGGSMGGGPRTPTYPTYTPPPAAPSMPDTYDSYTAAKNQTFGKPLASRGKGMQLGKKKATTSMFEQVRGDLGPEAETNAPLAGVPTQPTAQPVQPSLPTQPAHAAQTDAIHMTIAEAITARFTRDGICEAFEVKGDLQLRITDPSLTQLKIDLAVGDTRGAQLNAHPKVDKAQFKNNNIIQLTDPSKGFPANNSIQIMKWRLAARPEDVSDPPIKFTVWTSEISTNTYSITVEYELTGSDPLRDVTVVIPYSTSEPAVSSFDAVYEVSGDSIDWTIGDVDEGNGSGSFEFEAQAESEGEFFPMSVRFAKAKPWVDVDVRGVALLGSGGEEPILSLSPLLINTLRNDNAVATPCGNMPLPILSSKRLPHAIAADLVAYCDPHDLIAIATDAHDVVVYRLTGQVAFTVKRKDSEAEVTAVNWKQDGSVLAVGWSDGGYGLYSGESGKVLSSGRVSAEVEDGGDAADEVLRGAVAKGFRWTMYGTRVSTAQSEGHHAGLDLEDDLDEVETGLQGQTKPRADSKASIQQLTRSIATMDVTTILPRLSALPSHGLRLGQDSSRFTSQAAADTVFESAKDASTDGVDTLTITSNDGIVHVLMDDTVKIGTCGIVGSPMLQASHSNSPSHAVLSQTEDSQLHINTIGLPLDTLGGPLLHVIATNTKRTQILLSYTTQSIRCLTHDYTTGLAFPTRLVANMESELAEKQEGDLTSELYQLALTGVFTGPTNVAVDVSWGSLQSGRVGAEDCEGGERSGVSRNVAQQRPWEIACLDEQLRRDDRHHHTPPRIKSWPAAASLERVP
ncbi:coatomer subunit delta [Teratosphaeriaceae sp. CCFEE 6253]|nr:coatomer subunit delta [Teratosphaeriaceae sp. CCFEE 6253]